MVHVCVLCVCFVSRFLSADKSLFGVVNLLIHDFASTVDPKSPPLTEDEFRYWLSVRCKLFDRGITVLAQQQPLRIPQDCDNLLGHSQSAPVTCGCCTDCQARRANLLCVCASACNALQTIW